MPNGYLLAVVGSFLLFARLPAYGADRSVTNACPALEPTTSSEVANYVATKYHSGSSHNLSLRAPAQPNADCYWKFQYQVLSPQRDITVYLTPDHKYLVPAVFDRAVDPLAEEHKREQEDQRVLTSGRAASQGAKNASVTLVEFSDFQCPYCQRLAMMLEKEVLPGDPDVHLVFRNFPLPMHPWAQLAAQVASCAAMQSDDAFWKLHDYIFTNQREITAENVTAKLTAFVDTQLGNKQGAFNDCVEQGLSMGPVTKDMELGNKFGVHATPTVFINGSMVQGVRDSAQLKALIADARAGKLAPPATGSALQRNASGNPAVQAAAACSPTH